jgi:hypothetical protein
MKTAERLCKTKYMLGTNRYKCKTVKTSNALWVKHGWRKTKINYLIVGVEIYLHHS